MPMELRSNSSQLQPTNPMSHTVVEGQPPPPHGVVSPQAASQQRILCPQTFTQQSPPATFTQQSPPATYTQQSPPAAFTQQSPPAAFTQQSPAAAQLHSTSIRMSPPDPASSRATILSNQPRPPLTQRYQMNPDVMLDSKLDMMFSRFQNLLRQEVTGLKLHIEEQLNRKFDEMRAYVDLEVSRVENRVEALEAVTKSIADQQEQASVWDPDTTIVAENFPFEEEEELNTKVVDMIRKDLSVNVPVVRTTRLKARPPRNTRFGNVSKPGLVKIQFESVDDKVKVLREKRQLINSASYSRVFLRSSKSHTDRLLELNFKTMLDAIPNGKDYKLTANGRLVKRDASNNEATQQ